MTPEPVHTDLGQLQRDLAVAAEQDQLAISAEIRERDIAYWASPEGGRMAFNITSGVLSLTGPGENEVAALVNPAGSGRDIYLDLGEFGASSNTTFRRYRGATVTPNEGQTGISPVNMGGGSATSPLRMYIAGTYTRTGGTVAKSAHIAAFQQYITELGGRVVLRPGQSAAWTIQNLSALGSTITASVYFEFWEREAVA